MIQNFSPQVKALILDMDGVLWRGNQPIGDLKQVFARIHELGLKVICATNNSTSTPAQFAQKLLGYGVDLSPEFILNSGVAAAIYLKQLHPGGGPVFIVGENGLHLALKEKGFWHTDQDPIAVVAGMDRQVTYEKIAGATKWIRRGAPFIGTNPDKTFPTPDGLTPGSGSILAAIQAASGVDPTIIGKPEAFLYQVAMGITGTTPQETLAVGDRLDTDILGGQRAGTRTALVLSGVTTPEQAEQWSDAPDLIAQDLGEILR